MDEDTRSISWTVSEKESIITRIAQLEDRIADLESIIIALLKKITS